MITSIYNQKLNKLRKAPIPLLAGISNNSELVVRSVPNLSVSMILTASGTIGDIEWNSNGTLIFATVPALGIVHVWALNDREWSCAIETGCTGLCRAEWHPSSPIHLLVYSEFNTKVDIWDLQNKSNIVAGHVLANIGLVVSNAKGLGLLFSSLSDQDSDVASVIDLDCTNVNKNGFRVLSRIPLSHKPHEIEGAVWTANDDGFVVWESPVKSHIVQYDLHGSILSKVDLYPDIPSTVSCRPLGVSCFARNRNMLCLGTFMGTVQVYSLRGSVSSLAEFSLREKTIVVCNDNPKVFRESLGGSATVLERNMYYVGGFGHNTHGVEYRAVVPEKSTNIEGFSTVEIPVIDNQKEVGGHSIRGIAHVCISPDGMYLLCVSHNRSSTAFIYDLSKMTLAFVLIHRLPILDAQWSPCGNADRNEVCITTGDSRLFFWSVNEKSRIISMKDKSFRPTTILWIDDGSSLIATDEKRTCSVSTSETAPIVGG